MEKAILQVRTTKKGKIIVELQFTESNKTMPLPQLKLNNTDLGGTEVEVERESGKVVNVQAGEKAIYTASETPRAPAQQQRHQGGRRQQAGGRRPYQNQRPPQQQTEHRTVKEQGPMQIQHLEQVGDAAHAPYNFIPLNEKVVEVPRESLPPHMSFNTYHNERNTGWIDVTIESKTPLYIRDTFTEAEEGSGKINSDFYSPGGTPRIPGSSLRGMTRTLVEILGYGKFGAYNDTLLYYRGLADKSNLRKEYQDHMSSYDRRARKAAYKMEAGFLRRKKDSFKYEITPAESFWQIPKNKARQKVKGYGEFKFFEIDEGVLVVSGNMGNKKKDWIISKNELSEPITIPEDDVENYLNDSARAEDVPNLIQLADKMAAKNVRIPCFYARWTDSEGNDDRVSFGHTAMFRLAYEQSIGDHVPVAAYKLDDDVLKVLEKQGLGKSVLEKLGTLKKDQTYSKREFLKALHQAGITLDRKKERDLILQYASLIDLAEAIFGNETTFAGRVFFEDAVLDKKHKGETVLMEEGTPKILSTPKPTTFQHYLVQRSDNNRQLNHYNSNASIRGNKLYWHKPGAETNKNFWKEDPKVLEELKKEGKKDTQHTKIKPVKPKTTFTGRIRFENLSDIELGALLFALDLPPGCCHKLGLGKSLGLGSVKIAPTLFLSERKERYATLFGEVLPKKQDEGTVKKLKDRFSQHICEEIGEGSKKLWELDRLQELKVMLDFERGRKLEKRNNYMVISPKNEFKNRNVLPLPSQI